MCDVVDLLEDSPSPRAPEPPSDEQLRQAIKAQLLGKDLSTISLKALRLDLERSFHLPSGGLDGRKADIRQLAQDLVIEAQNTPAAPAPPAPSTPVEPASKKRRTLAQAIPTAPAPVPGAAPASPVKTKAPKRKATPSAYSLWSLEHRATVAADLEMELQRKPTFGEIGKAVPERWKEVSQEERAIYEEKAKVAKSESAGDVAAKPPKAPAPPSNRKGKGRGKGKGKGKDGEDPAMSRAEFFRASPVINCALQIPGVEASESSMENLTARMFKSQGVGWFCSTKFQIPVGSSQVTVQAQVVMNVAGSKHWEDGEGLDEVMKGLEQRTAEGTGSTEALAAAPEAAAPEPSEEPAPQEGEAPCLSSAAHSDTSQAVEAEVNKTELGETAKEDPNEDPNEEKAEECEDHPEAKAESEAKDAGSVEAAPDATMEAEACAELKAAEDEGTKGEEDTEMPDANQEPIQGESGEVTEACANAESELKEPACDDTKGSKGEVDEAHEAGEETEASDPTVAEVEQATDAGTGDADAPEDLQEKASIGGA